MPIYEYRCASCKCGFQKIVPVHKRGQQFCPSCYGDGVLQVSVPNIKTDTFIGGRMDPTFGYVTGKKELQAKEKAAGLRRTDPGDKVIAMAARAGREHKEDIIREKAVGGVVREMCF